VSLKLSAPIQDRGDRRGCKPKRGHALAQLVGGCQFLIADGERCPHEALWHGIVAFARHRYEVATCDLHRESIGEPRPLRGE
jgi:hypothetical protein